MIIDFVSVVEINKLINFDGNGLCSAAGHHYFGLTVILTFISKRTHFVGLKSPQFSFSVKKEKTQGRNKKGGVP